MDTKVFLFKYKPLLGLVNDFFLICVFSRLDVESSKGSFGEKIARVRLPVHDQVGGIMVVFDGSKCVTRDLTSVCS